ncbi:chemotaxis protein CheA [Flexithrix dorotheae]|uniref:chemotaxis protein CheA n=1 Tax=Flexithrix dorotheae TaxID=70993 RepID=UPI0003793259|nr:chemotaxis protein CheA [Flexithrix dorotheae]
MKSKEEEYKEIFLAEAHDNIEELNKLLTQLEKNKKDKKIVDSIFRITHTLKGNAGGMGFSEVNELTHTMEDFFDEIRKDIIPLDHEIFPVIFKSIDVLSNLIDSISSKKRVQFRGLKTRLEVIINRHRKAAGLEEVDHAKKNPDRKETKKASKASGNPTPKKRTVPDTKEQIKTPLPEVIEEVNNETEPEEEVSEINNKITFSDLVQVPVRKLDQLLNLVGELIIEKDRIITSNPELAASNEYSMLSRISSELQYSVMDVRLVQVGFLFNKFHRVVRDAANLEGKQVNLKLEGTETEIDRNILQIISDSLIHLIRNAIGHGIETADKRISAGKKAEGIITLSAQAESEGVIMKIIDDGKGIDVNAIRNKAIQRKLVNADTARHLSHSEIISFIFEPGFSTVEEINAISGRGVGMDVVKNAVESVGGSIFVESEVGKGTTFTLTLPSSMAVKGTLLFELGNTEYAIPLNYTEAVVAVSKSQIKKLNRGLATVYSGKTISVVFLKSIFNPNLPENDPDLLFNQLNEEEKLNLVIVAHNNRMVAIVVDKLLQQKEIIEKPLLKPLDHVKYISGVTIMGNGHVCLVLNVPGILNNLFKMTIKKEKLKEITEDKV